MINIYQRQAAAFRNEMRTSCAALVGIVQGLLADKALNDDEIHFLNGWLHGAQDVALSWPGNVIHAQVQSALADGIVTAEERAHLVDTLQQLLGGKLDEVAEASFVTELAIDRVEGIEVEGKLFCFTGDFVFGPRKICEQAIERRGGLVSSVTKKLDYLVIGGLGSPEWKHGSFGTKIEKAMQHKQSGSRIFLVHEDTWASALSN
ncbi:NAD-dependent DNA ligase [Variovorax sp. J22R24]|uniref:NAD-dependent DNA ligase n=1 Tax=Variovorax gracilis TaxID=3053502 RepID=UPI0025756D66|nr:NAD-dependent DNA ligase [Variovorax sp. J22R24]MDM0109829.1 NAD-dependent DNA ligase [Variovorax sp. J22R24]